MSWRLTVVALCALLASASSAVAQEYGTPPLPRGEVSAGYLFAREVGNDGYTNDGHGWKASVAFNLNQWFALAIETSGAYDRPSIGSTSGRYAYVGGPRFFWKRGRVVPFTQLLVGGLFNDRKSWYEAGYAIQPGAGLTVLATEHLGIRVAGDYQRAIYLEDWGREGRVRVSGGLVFGWGAR